MVIGPWRYELLDEGLYWTFERFMWAWPVVKIGENFYVAKEKL